MGKIEICRKLKASTKKLLLFDGDAFAGFSGTGVVVKKDGTLLTANHVVAPYTNLDNPKVFAFSSTGVSRNSMEYKVRLFNVSVDINMPNFARPLLIDLAILEPVENAGDQPYIPLKEKLLVEGENVIMAGFPDEILPPLNFNRMLNFDNPELAERRNQIEMSIENFIPLMMIKSGMVGSVQKVNIEGSNKNITANGAVYWIDNGSNNGASGGPVADSSGKLTGIISEKGLTTQELVDGYRFKVPSGATMALSPHLIAWGM